MARGFGGETTEQEARGIDNSAATDSSMASVASGRSDAATSAMASGRDVDPGGGSDGSGGFLSNDYTPDFNRVSQIQDTMQARETFNRSRGITSTNPFGNDNPFTKYLGIDPKNIDYSNNINRSNRISIANNQFSKFMNPQNKPGMVGYNPDFPTAEEGQLRSGVQSAGYKTQFGDVMGQPRQQDIGEMTARGLAGLFGGLPGLALGQIGTKEYGLPGQPGFESFDPNNPNPGGGILGQFLGGLNPTQAKDALVGAFAPVAPAPEPTPIGTTPLNLTGFENRFLSQHPLTGEKTVSTPVDNTLQPGFSRTTTETLPDGRKITVDKKTGAVFGTNLFGEPQSSLQNTVAEEQLAGLFGEDRRTAGFRDLEGMIKSVVDGENLPDNQNMYGPGMPDLTPGELNNILESYDMELGRGPSTANQFAEVDFSNLNNVGDNLYQSVPDTSAFESFLERFGMSEPKRRSSGQIYSPNKSRSFFDNPVGYVLGS